MKRFSYYHVHKNKKPKKLQGKKLDLRLQKAAAIMIRHSLNIEKIKHCQNMSFSSKSMAVSNEVIHTASKIASVFSTKSKYLQRINKK